MVECFPEKNLIVSSIKSVEICLTPNKILKILKTPLEGPSVFGDNWYDDLELDHDSACKAIFKADVQDLNTSNLLPTPKILANMCRYSFLPKNGSYDQISNNDILHIYHLLIGDQINLPMNEIGKCIKSQQALK